jgi:NitT/TauT family transport system permease protein
VLLPASLPQILVGLRLGLSVSIGGVILAEMVAAQSGLGVLIERSRVTLSPEPMVVGILTIGIIGYLANRAMLLIEGRLTKYRAATLQQVD